MVSFLRVCSALAVLGCGSVCLGDTVVLTAIADATLYESEFGNTANSKGQYIFAGRNSFFPTTIRRALIRFDLSSIPAGSTIDSAEVTLRLSRTITGDQPVSLHRATTAWGEGTSVPFGQEGPGTAATPGDPTWNNSVFPDLFWSTPGGDFIATPSATGMVGAAIGTTYAWTGPGLLADVQAWYDGSQPNHGWAILGNEVSDASAKRFDSRESLELGAVPPTLVVSFTPPPPCTGDYNGDLMVTFADITTILAQFNSPYTFADITVVLANFGNPC